MQDKKIELYNSGKADLDLTVSVIGLDDIIGLYAEDLSFILKSNERRTIEIKIIAPGKPGVYTGKLVIGDKEVLITINVNTKELLFDAGIVIPDEFKTINAGDKLESQVTIIPMGEEPRVDTTLNYVIKDFEGRTFLSESETMLVDSQKTFKKEFSTQNLITGNYILGLELIYPNGVATSTSHFEIKAEEDKKYPSYNILLFGILGFLLLSISALILIIKRYKSMKRFKRLRQKRES